ncbi:MULTISPECIES: hypothetical protein [Enterobacteriaceae]|uniref:Uncharacterized protein n=1 Tax=Citrobacter telavivensis TaxID=2653932 RepID=A0A6L5EFA5_9ENTR|nr:MULTISPECIES: hypothetical protein [Enterobacteriaceae]HDR2614796.1 hypothetical protein [Enterobacter ludwigii]KLV70755.1 hypothetical protein SK37_05005 [Citrobacter sp. MGH109]MDT7093099.1 hypothetical protein [Citrobacter freundii]MPQ54187.1 hypothetical protein [Citrobacter telavivensis]QFS69013.1 hypothetical protein GBC03_01735 [Citrobacter telavivensis]
MKGTENTWMRKTGITVKVITVACLIQASISGIAFADSRWTVEVAHEKSLTHGFLSNCACNLMEQKQTQVN